MYPTAAVNLSAAAEKAREVLESDRHILIVCAGRDAAFSLDDAYCAGRFAAAVLGDTRPRRGLNDAAIASLDLVRRYRDGWERPLRYSRAGRELVKLGFRDDLREAARTGCVSGAAALPRAPGHTGGGTGMSTDSRRRTGRPHRSGAGPLCRSHLASDSHHGSGWPLHRSWALANSRCWRAGYSAARGRAGAGGVRPIGQPRHEAIGGAHHRTEPAHSLPGGSDDPRGENRPGHRRRPTWLRCSHRRCATRIFRGGNLGKGWSCRGGAARISGAFRPDPRHIRLASVAAAGERRGREGQRGSGEDRYPESAASDPSGGSEAEPSRGRPSPIAPAPVSPSSAPPEPRPRKEKKAERSQRRRRGGVVDEESDLPPVDLLTPPSNQDIDAGEAQLDRLGHSLIETLRTFKVEGRLRAAHDGSGGDPVRGGAGPGRQSRADRRSRRRPGYCHASALGQGRPHTGQGRRGRRDSQSHARIVTLRELFESSDWASRRAVLP